MVIGRARNVIGSVPAARQAARIAQPQPAGRRVALDAEFCPRPGWPSRPPSLRRVKPAGSRSPPWRARPGS